MYRPNNPYSNELRVYCPQAGWYDFCTISKRASQMTRFGSAQIGSRRRTDKKAPTRWRRKKLYQLSKDTPSHQHLTQHLILLQSTCPGGFKYKKTKKFCHSLEDGGVEAEKMGGRGGKGNGEGENKLKTVRVRGGAYCRRGEGKNAHKKRKKKR